MTIFKHGWLYNRVIECKCGCNFKFEVGDINKVDTYANYGMYKVECPECGQNYSISNRDYDAIVNLQDK